MLSMFLQPNQDSGEWTEGTSSEKWRRLKVQWSVWRRESLGESIWRMRGWQILQGFFQPLLTVGYPPLPKKIWYFGGFFKGFGWFFKGFGCFFKGFGWFFKGFGCFFKAFFCFVFQTHLYQKILEKALKSAMIQQICRYTNWAMADYLLSSAIAKFIHS